MKLIFTLLLAISFVASAWADVGLGDVFTDDMVLQRNKPVAIWGEADADVSITVKFAGQVKTARADASGRWFLRLDPMPASAEPRSLTVHASAGNQEQEISGVLVGEVWLAGGQSNMEMALRSTIVGPQILPTLDKPLIRFYNVPRNEGHEPERSKAKWTTSAGNRAAYFSAVGWFFAADLYDKLGVPIGIISCSLGASSAETWMSAEQLRRYPDLAPLADQYDTLLKQYDQAAVQAYLEEVKAWKTIPKDQRSAKPKSPPNPYYRKVGTALYRSMLSTILPATFRGTIWYQGESNTRRSEEYRTLFPALIKSWREDFENPEMPFYFVQLAAFQSFSTQQPPLPGWAELREAQLHTWQTVPNTGMASAVDWGEQYDIHPKNKKPVGERLALFARRDCYGESDLLVSGPIYRSSTIKGEHIKLTFDYVGGGLTARGDLENFEICGPDLKFHSADAQIIGDAVVISSPKVKNAVAARYGWESYFVASLFNEDGLPASPFRTDRDGQ